MCRKGGPEPLRDIEGVWEQGLQGRLEAGWTDHGACRPTGRRCSEHPFTSSKGWGPWDPDEARRCQHGTSAAMKPKKGSGQSRQGQEAENGLRKEQPSLQLASTSCSLGTSSEQQGVGGISNLRDSHALLRTCKQSWG